MRKPLLAYAGAVAIASVIGLAILPGSFAKLRRAVAPHVPQAVRECYSWTIAAARRAPPFLYAFLSSRFASGVSERRAAGSELFQEFCSACHGIEQANASLLARQSFSKLGDFGTGRLLLAEDPPGDMPPFGGYFSSRQIFEIVSRMIGGRRFQMAAARRYKAIIAQLRVFIDERPDHWWVYINDIDHPGILFQIKTTTLEEAQERATAFTRQHLLPEVEGQEDELPHKLDWELI